MQVTREDVRLIGESLLARGVAAVSVRAAPRHPSGPLHPSLFGASANDLLSNFPMEDAPQGTVPPSVPQKGFGGLAWIAGTSLGRLRLRPGRFDRADVVGDVRTLPAGGLARPARAWLLSGAATIMLQLVQYTACFHSSAAAAAALSSRLLAHAPIWNAPQESIII